MKCSTFVFPLPIFPCFSSLHSLIISHGKSGGERPSFPLSSSLSSPTSLVFSTGISGTEWNWIAGRQEYRRRRVIGMLNRETSAFRDFEIPTREDDALPAWPCVEAYCQLRVKRLDNFRPFFLGSNLGQSSPPPGLLFRSMSKNVKKRGGQARS